MKVLPRKTDKKTGRILVKKDRPINYFCCSMVKLFLGGFPLDKTELELVQLVSPYGEVATIKIVRDKKTKVCKGYAFLEMTDQQSAEQVIEALDGTRWDDRLLTLNRVADTPAPADAVFNRPKRPRLLPGNKRHL